MVRLITYSVYILSNKHRNVFYVGVTSDLEGRVLQHKQGEGSVFTKQYNCYDLLYYEDYNDIRNAIAREKQLKKWKRHWKLETIQKENPDMRDLAEKWYQ